MFDHLEIFTVGWVTAAHDSIKQKRTDGSDYHTHPRRVAYDLATGYGYKDLYIPALLHDTLEDIPWVTYEHLIELFGSVDSNIVVEVTNVYTKKNYPELNRRERKIREAVRLGQISFKAKLIKLGDIKDNLSDVIEQKPHMAGLYLKEKQEVLDKMVLNDPKIEETALFADVQVLINDKIDQLHG